MVRQDSESGEWDAILRLPDGDGWAIGVDLPTVGEKQYWWDLDAAQTLAQNALDAYEQMREAGAGPEKQWPWTSDDWQDEQKQHNLGRWAGE